MSTPDGWRLLAVADDPTGAVACGAELRRAGLRVVVRAWDRRADDGADALVVDTASRPLPAGEAAERVRAAVAGARAALGDGATAYKRLDSGLRGHVGVELAAFADAVGLPVVVAPAAPAYGFTTVDGTQHLDGEAVSAAAYGGVGDAPGEPSLPALLPGPTIVLGLRQVRGGDLPAALAAAVAAAAFVVCDAERTADLTAVARAVEALDAPVALAGSYGLAGAVAALRARPSEARVVVVAGSPQPATARQLAELAEEGGAVEVVASPALAAGRAADPAVARALAGDAVRRALDGPLAGLVLVGGDTAAATLAAAGATGLELVCEPWPATPVVRLLGGELDGVPAIVKSGARGDARWLVHAVDVLRRGAS